jgi:transcriptional regulator with GAF, ATPase, and Fis domain
MDSSICFDKANNESKALVGEVRHKHSKAHSIRDEQREVIKEIDTVVDVTEHCEASTSLDKALEEINALKEQVYRERVVLREEVDRCLMFEEIVGDSPALESVLRHVVKVAPTDSTVLITGETGTGKELIARAIHKRSKRSNRAFVSVNCGSIPSSLVASELFGHERGAFTGALQQRQGRFELAHGGTIFLDEVGELPPDTQIALLRVLQEREFERVGGTRPLHVDVRVIAATNRDLPAAVASGTFRSDLFYRLNVFPLEVPPLRNRKEDIPMLVEYFVQRLSQQMGKHVRRIDRKTLDLCQRYDWPGNIRELQNIVERAVILSENDIFSIEESWLLFERRSEIESSGSLRETLLDQERKIIEAALVASKGKIAGHNGAAVKLGIPPSTLDSKIKQFKLKKEELSRY